MATIVHEVDAKNAHFRHRLVVDGVEGQWVGYSQIAENGKARALIQEYWGEDQPRVFESIPLAHTVLDV